MKKINIDYDSPCRLRQEYGEKINELIELYHNIDNAYRKYYQELKDQIEEIKQYLDWDEISGENTQNSTNNSEKLHLFQGNEHFADTSKKIKRAADSANKNLDNALDVAVDALKRIAEPESWSPIYAEQDIAKGALIEISKILKITKGGKDE